MVTRGVNYTANLYFPNLFSLEVAQNTNIGNFLYLYLKH